MSTQVNPGKGTLLQYGTGVSPYTYVTIAQRVSIDGPEIEVGTADTTTLDSSTKTSRPTLPDGGELSGTLFYDPQDTTHLFLFNLLATPAITPFQLVFADTAGTKWTFMAILTKFKPNGMEVESNLGADFTIKLNGVPTHTP